MRVLITGCSRGIGRATAQLLQRNDHEVIATSINAASLVGLDATQSLAMDVTSGESVLAAVAAAGRIDAVVNNAGVGIRGPIETLTVESMIRAYNLNVFGALRVIQAVLPQMRARRSGRIVSLSSVAGRRAMPLVGQYSATKHALEAISEALRYEVHEWQIKVSVVEPAAVATEFSAHRIGPDASSTVIAEYANLATAVELHARRVADAPATAEQVARTILDVLQDPEPPLRVPATEQAREMIDRRRATDDATWEENLVADLAR